MATITRSMGRKPAELSPEFRRALRRAHRKAKSSQTELRQLVLEARSGDSEEEKEPLGAIAREMGVSKSKLHAWIQAWTRDGESE